jgi:hypothetical protein
MKIPIVILMLVCLPFMGFAQKKLVLDASLSALVQSIIQDPVYIKTGNLLPYPGELSKNHSKPVKIHFSFVTNYNQQVIEIGASEFKTKLSFADEIQPVSIFKNPFIDSSAKIYSNKEVYVLGTLTVVGVYIPTNTSLSTTNTIYLDIIKIGRESKKSQLNQLVKLVKHNNTWKVDTSIVMSRS